MVQNASLGLLVAAIKRQAEGGVAAVERALAILAAFDEHVPVLSLAELASRTGLYKSTILRLLVSLERRGFVERRPDGRYRIGSQAWRVGALFTLDLTLEKILLPIMERLSAEVRESVSFYVPLLDTTPPMRMCLLRVAPQRRVRDIFHVGNRLPMDKGAGGRVIRAFADPSYREDDCIRTERAYSAWGELDPEVCAVGSPVMGPDGRLLGALVLSAPSARHDPSWLEAMKPIVITAAEEASRNFKPLGSLPISNTPELFPDHSVISAARAKGAGRP
jgi:DNA-binding IclR family transcriptional regulator